MKVTTHSIAEFIQSLSHVEEIYDSVIRVSIYRNKIGEASSEVFIEASTVVLAGATEYLLRGKERCGVDRPREPEGTQRAEVLKHEIQTFAFSKSGPQGRSWRLLPGIIDE